MGQSPGLHPWMVLYPPAGSSERRRGWDRRPVAKGSAKKESASPSAERQRNGLTLPRKLFTSNSNPSLLVSAGKDTAGPIKVPSLFLN